MIGKFLFGAFFGGVTVAGGLVAASLITPATRVRPEAAQIEAGPVEKPKALGADVAAADVRPVDPPEVAAATKADPAAAPVTKAEPDAATADPVADGAASVAAMPEDDAIATLQPEIGTASAEAAEQAPASEAVTAIEDVPVGPAPVVVALADPLPAPSPEPVEAEVAAPVVTEVPAPDLPRGPAQPPAPDQDAVVIAVDAPVPTKDEMAATGLVEPAPPVAEAEPEVIAEAEIAPEPEAMPQTEVIPEAPEGEPEVETAQLPVGDASGMPGVRPAGLPGTASDGNALPEAEVAVLPEAEASTLKPAPDLGERAEGVITGRLPRIGDAPAEPPAVTDPGTDEPAATAELDTRPIVQNAASFENPEAKPLFAIVLIDDGATTLDRAALAALPFPVSFALDPLDTATPERAAIYRAAGKEVVMLATGLAEGAQASDVEVAFQAMEQGLPEAVAVMDLPEKRFQDNRPLASLVVPVVAAQGRGLLTWDQGLNAADQVARREDLAASVVFRAIDGGGEDRIAMHRALDRAAFKSAQDGRVTVVGNAAEETVAALLEWTVEGRAATVALAPLSAVLTID